MASQEVDKSTCCYNGFEFKPMEKGQYYHKYGRLYDYEDNLVSDSVEWEFSFKKYLERYNIENLNAVSLLFGGNDLFPWNHYDGVADAVCDYIENIKRFIIGVKAADKDIDVIINLPIPSSEQNAFANIHGCLVTDKQYKNAVHEGMKAVPEEFEGVDGVYICPMSHVIDTKNGFDKISIRANLYCDKQIEIISDPVHPNTSGYCQMGDVLAGTVEMLRHRRIKNV